MCDVSFWIGTLIAGSSLIVSIVALCKSSRAQKRILQIEESRENDRLSSLLEANLRAESRQRERNSRHLFIVNEGAAEARHIRVEIDDQPLKDHDLSVGDPMPELVGPRCEISCRVMYDPHRVSSDVKVVWDDDSGKDRVFRTTVSW